MKSKPNFPSRASLQRAAEKIGCRVETIEAIASVEAGENGAFLETGEPVILYEPHVFSRLTNHKYDGYYFNEQSAFVVDKTYQLGISGRTPKWKYISYPKWRSGWYGPVSAQHDRLQIASRISRVCALQSCSWGLYQLMGFNYKRCGHDTLQSFINVMYRSVDDHLNALVSFVLYSSKITKAIIDRDAKSFAKLYNGPSYAKNKYDTRLIEAGF